MSVQCVEITTLELAKDLLGVCTFLGLQLSVKANFGHFPCTYRLWSFKGGDFCRCQCVEISTSELAKVLEIELGAKRTHDAQRVYSSNN